ncbi:MAG: prohibitin family protein [bacterium]
MIPFIILLIVAGVILYMRYAPQINMKMKKGTMISIVIAVLVIALIISAVRIVPPGFVGVQILLGKVQGRILSSGIHLVVPLVTVEQMSIRTQDYTMSSTRAEGKMKGDDAISALTSDGLSINLDLTIWYKLDKAKAGEVFEEIGPNYIEKIVRPSIRTAIRDAAVNYNVTEIYSTKRAVLTDEIYALMFDKLNEKGVIIDRVLLRKIELPLKVRNAIDEKIAAEQDAQKMVYVLQKEEKEKERKLIEAEGIANANRMIRQSLSAQYLQWYYIQNLKDVLKSNGTRTVILPFDQNLTPLLDVSK